ncbi:craniofacial development protein 2-like protein [Plakobranchus ocellatus]|uniref:Craniofacial development protein 2-like protein n=1 Tax=Plakobranchus ocellatus TaxID=259542 RepID=A0AAV3ZPM5_9GAST|nr:craniofacial development protein 2-like protein [Plakobranchus ocellatus]
MEGAEETRGQGYTMINSGDDEHQRGVSSLLDNDCSKALKGFWAVNDRIIVAKLNGKHFDFGITRAYTATTDKDEEVIEQFYEDLDKALKKLKSKDIKTIMGDFNSKVRNEKVENIFGRFGTDKMNEGGEQLTDCCKENKFIVTNT